MSLAELDSLIQRVNLLATDFFNNPTNSTTCNNLDESLHSVVRSTSTIDPTGRLNPLSFHVNQFLVNANELLTYPSTSIITKSKLYLILYNICQHNIRTRRYMAAELQIVGSIFRCLSQSIREQLGPQNLIDILRLIQYLTYEKCVALGSWTSELLSYVLGEITSTVETEWLPYCIAILCNLAKRSKHVCQRIKSAKNYHVVDRNVARFLKHDSRILVISCLTLIGYLNDKVRDLIYAPNHLPQTFLCVFNIIKTADTPLTRQFAIDLCKRLIISESTHLSVAPTMASSAKDLLTYKFFPSSIQELASYLVILDARTEESLRIYDLLVIICQLQQFRSAVCSSILKTKPCETRLTTPVLGILRTASLTFEDAIEPEVPLVACELLTFLLREIVESGNRLVDYVPIEGLIELIRFNVKTAVETKSELVSYQCRRITCGLKLADAIAADDDARRELFDSLTAQLCAHINESQLVSNPVLNYLSKPPGIRGQNELPEWSLHGVKIPLELFKLLSTLKDYNKAHKELYWKTLKDERLIPFIAFALQSGEGNTVLDALNLYAHCTQVQDYRAKLLSDLIASCNITKHKHERHGSESGSRSRQSVEAMDTSDDIGRDVFIPGNGTVSRPEVDNFLKLMKENSGGDAKLSHVLQAFEQKIAMMEDNEKVLRKMIDEKDKTLQESQRMWALQRSQLSTTDSVELKQLRVTIADFEKQMNEAETEKAILNEEKRQLADRLAKQEAYHERMMETLNKQVADLKKEKELLVDENKKEREIQLAIRAKFDEMTAKFDEATQAAFEKEKEVVNISRKLENSLQEIENMKSRIKSEQQTIQEKESTISMLTSELEKLKILKQTMAKMLSGN
uniref:Protein CIP2A n=1 Tax=Panagrolaimus sp. JU765 TaxID=591449 RepID=A0AC34R801_9BILA